MEDFPNRVVDLSDAGIPIRYLLIFESFRPHKHAFQDIYDLDLQLRIWDLLVYRKEDV